MDLQLLVSGLGGLAAIRGRSGTTSAVWLGSLPPRLVGSLFP
ncbi:hypothetical protein [Streptomyces millisiae]|uniref:Uncharacterized protein n=1 Tax=Streptomyces millisiae TaxID=3075542 RepID=A0ABU2LH70_9ACTN|nr:hypothetical protein [Streptomyces sp. DSM 44918]MDT0316934.1 hypothetical protein [Streptomyces sp. DSM 44918]